MVPIVTWGFQESTICLNTVEVHLLRNFIGKTKRVKNQVKEKVKSQHTCLIIKVSQDFFFKKKKKLLHAFGWHDACRKLVELVKMVVCRTF